MSERKPQYQFIKHVSGVVIAAATVTAASILWEIPQKYGTAAVNLVYFTSAFLLLLGGFLVFRRIVLRSYLRYRQLNPLASFLQLLIWGLFFAFPCIYLPGNWAWSGSEVSQAYPYLGITGWIFTGVGLAVLIGSFVWLGLPRAFGQPVKDLETSGPYSLSRNPQLIGGALIVLGYFALWPSCYSIGWLVLFAATAHQMVLTEEQFLVMLYKEWYQQYCQRVHRYLGIKRK